MVIFLDESGDLGWSFDKPFFKGGSSRFFTIAGILLEENQPKRLARSVHELLVKHNLNERIETKGSKFSDNDAVSIVKELKRALEDFSFQILSVTADKRKVIEPLRRDKNIFYNHMLSFLLADIVNKYSTIDIVIDDRTIRHGSRNSFEDCLRAKCWGELGINTNISCRYEDSTKNPGIWLADWIANFIWRHYEYQINDPYLECLNYGTRYHEKTLFI